MGRDDELYLSKKILNSLWDSFQTPTKGYFSDCKALLDSFKHVNDKMRVPFINQFGITFSNGNENASVKAL